MKREIIEKGVFTAAVVLVLCGNVFAGWSAPVLLSELNGPGGEIADSPVLSSDGLTIYFHREIAGLGHTCIVEAHRDAADGPFTSERVLTELIVTGYNLTTPWISQDNLRLYYCEAQAVGAARIKMARRSSTSQAWTPAVRIFDELHIDEEDAAAPVLTADELAIFFYSTRPGSEGGKDLWMAIRDSTEEPFGNIRPLYELNTPFDEDGPHISPDGLTLYFHGYNRDGYSGHNLYVARRTSAVAIFGNAQLVALPFYESRLERSPYATPDEQTIYYGGGAGEAQGIWVCRWQATPRTFHVDAVNGDDSNDGLTKATAFATIQHAIDMSEDGSTVLVWPGVYNEQVNFIGKAITLQSAADAAVVRTDMGYAFSFHSGEGADSVLKNFVIRDGEYGIFLTNASSPTISNLTVVGNGFGIAAYDGSDPTIVNCILWNDGGDLEGCRATYSCIRDGAPGEGNISVYPLFADPAGNDYHLLSERGRYVPVDPTLPPWTEPVHLPELDDGQGNNASGPFLSEDGLTMYIHRFVPALGYNCIIEFSRTVPGGVFTLKRIASELVDNCHAMFPWVSQDGLRLYYQEIASTRVRLRMAQRSGTGDAWVPVRTFDELAIGDDGGRAPSLTADELSIFFFSARAGSAGKADLWMAIRSSVDQPFGNDTFLRGSTFWKHKTPL